jgi:hypothetical protein
MVECLNVDKIDPFTATNTFGVSYNGGYKPDPTISWIAADDNSTGVVYQEPVPTNDFNPAAPAYFNTCEARRFDPREGGIPLRSIQYDDKTHVEPQIKQIPLITKHEEHEKDEKRLAWNIFMIILIIMIVVFISRLE